LESKSCRANSGSRNLFSTAVLNLRRDRQEALVTKRTFGLFAGIVGSAVGAWWWARQRSSMVNQHPAAGRERGTVIFDNTPTATPDAII
jgi:hypothetical protein